MIAREQVIALLDALDDELGAARLRVDVYLVEDGIVPIADHAAAAQDIWAAVARVAERHPGLDSRWLDQALSDFCPGDYTGHRQVPFTGSNLRVLVDV